jgi:hypothetical protein
VGTGALVPSARSCNFPFDSSSTKSEKGGGGGRGPNGAGWHAPHAAFGLIDADAKSLGNLRRVVHRVFQEFRRGVTGFRVEERKYKWVRCGVDVVNATIVQREFYTLK